MIKRIIYISSPCYISSENEQLVIDFKEKKEKKIIPIEDMGIVEFDSPQILITSFALNKLMTANVPVMICDDKHQPAGLAVPLIGNHIQAKRIKAQAEAKQTLNNNLWGQIISYKIKNQGKLLRKIGKDFATLERLASNVKSGDTGNNEAKASQNYWKLLFGDIGFKRERFGIYPNNLLNYGYSILRAITARAIVNAGLHPTLGIHHKNQYNGYCLADDLMEPYRPFVDAKVVEMFLDGRGKETDKNAKAELLSISWVDSVIKKKTHPLFIAVQTSVNSVTACFMKEKKKVEYPVFT